MKLILTTVLIAIALWIALLYVVVNSHLSLAWIAYCALFGGGTILCLAGIVIEYIINPDRRITSKMFQSKDDKQYFIDHDKVNEGIDIR